MRFFIETRTDRAGEASHQFVRLRDGEPMLCAEALHRDATWHRDERLFRQRMLGADFSFAEVAEPEFLETLGSRNAGGESVGRPSEEDLERMIRVEAEIVERRSQDSVPPTE